MRFYRDNFERTYRRGLDAYRKGDLAEARFYLLQAAHYLFKLAAASEGSLKEARKSKAAKLLAMAKEIDPRKSAAGKRLPPQMEKEEKKEPRKWLLQKRPDVTFNDVAGLYEVKAIIKRRIIYPFLNPETAKKYRKKAGGGLLLYGPPGNGKTMIAKAVAGELDAAFFSVKCSDIISKWVGEAERNLKELFESARSQPKAVVFMDETEAIVAKRGGHSTVMNRVIPEFLSQVDGLDSGDSNLLLMGATNRPWDMDTAALRTGRFGELVYVGLPDNKARRKILEKNLEGVPMAPEIDLSELAESLLEGYSGADIVGFCIAVTDAPFEREITTGIPQCVEKQDVERALQKVRPSVSRHELKKYRDFSRSRLTP